MVEVAQPRQRGATSLYCPVRSKATWARMPATRSMATKSVAWSLQSP